MNTRRARSDDANAACLVMRRSITELCALDHGGDAQLLAKWLSNKTAENVKRWISQSNVFVAEQAGRILGVAALDGSGKITLNYVSPDARFRGVSKVLVRCMEEEAKARGLEECWLESTQTALRFYRDLGYAVSDRSYILPLTWTPATVLTKRLRPPQP
jgi:N-acetylglutamate synthase-like GNAT family acetyltransferase